MTDELPTDTPARANRALDSLHAMIYFAPEADEELSGVGLRPGRMTYFASRSAPMGPVSAGVVAATFYNFNPALVARHIPRAWGLASIEDILAARLRAVDRAMRRLLGERVQEAPEIVEAAELARAATAALPPDGRPLYAAHAELSWPAEAHLALWHSITLLREYRGDGHVAALLCAEVSGLDALITHTATGRGFTEAAAKATRGWSDAEWSAGVEALRARGIVEDAGLTAGGLALRTQVEDETDRLSMRPWQTLGAERTSRLVEIGRGLSRQVLAGGAFPADVFAARR